MNLFRSQKLEIDVSPCQLFVIVYDNSLANKINRALDNYYPDSIERGAEPIFKITIADSQKLANFLRTLPKSIQTLIESKINEKETVLCPQS
jgi:hypothetical protein